MPSFICKRTKGCLFPDVGLKKKQPVSDAQRNHSKEYHGSYATFYPKSRDESYTSPRQPDVVGKLRCFCNDRSHDRYSHSVMRKIMSLKTHPYGPIEDSNLQDHVPYGPKSPDGGKVAEEGADSDMDVDEEVKESDVEKTEFIALVDEDEQEHGREFDGNEIGAGGYQYDENDASMEEEAFADEPRSDMEIEQNGMDHDNVEGELSIDVGVEGDGGGWADREEDAFRNDESTLNSKLPAVESKYLYRCDESLSANLSQLEIERRLTDLEVVVNLDLRIVICPRPGCRTPLPHNHVWAHYMKSNHWVSNQVYPPPTRPVFIQWLKRLGLDRHPNSLVGSIVDAPYGVRLNTESIKCVDPTCTVDCKVFANKEMFNRHCRVSGNHEQDLLAEDRPFKKVVSFATTIFDGTRKHVEVVVREVVRNEEDPRISQVLDAVDEEDRKTLSESIFPGYVDDRQAPPWVALTGWAVYLVGVDTKHLRGLLTLPSSSANEPLCRLASPIYEYYLLINDELNSLSTDIRGMFGSTEHDRGEKELRKVNLSTVRSYSNTAVAMVLFFIRLYHDPLENYKSYLDTEHEASLSALVDALNDGSSSDEDIQSYFHLTLISLTKHNSKEFEDFEDRSLFHRFQIANSLNPDGLWLKASNVTHNIAALQWPIRCTWVREYFDKKGANPEMSRWDVFNTFIRDFISKPRDRTRCSFYTAMDDVMGRISSYSETDAKLPSVTWTHDKYISVNGHSTNTDLFRSGVRRSITDLEYEIRQLVPYAPFTQAVKEIEDLVNHPRTPLGLVDDPQEHYPNCSIFDREPTGAIFKRIKDSMRKLFMTDDHYFPFDSKSGKMMANRESIRTFFQRLDDIVSLLYFVILNTMGGGGRAPDLNHLRYVDSLQGERSLYAILGVAVIVTTYTKSQNLRGQGMLIVRTPPRDVTKLLLLVITVLYPVARAMYPFIGNDSAAKNYNTFIFLRSGFQLSENEISALLKSYSQRYFLCGLMSRDYRQLLHSFQNKFIGIDFQDGDEALDILFGHSTGTARKHYDVRSIEALPRLDHRSISEHQNLSYKWHRWLGLPTDECDTPEEHPGNAIAAQKSFLTKEDFDKFTEGIFRLMESKIDTSFAILYRRIMGSPSTTGYIDPSDIVVHTRLKETIAFISPYPEFRSVQQAQLIQSSFSDFHVVGILATGSGKALAFFAPAYFDSGNLQVVFTPYVSLTEDLAHRIRLYQLKGGTWKDVKDKPKDEVAIVIVTLDDMLDHRFLGWMTAQAKRIKRIYVDEAHDLYMALLYRRKFSLFKNIITSIGARITFLSATMPPKSLDYFLHQVGIHDRSNVVVIRGEPYRPNLQYNVTVVDPRDLLDRTSVLYHECRSKVKEGERGIVYFRNKSTLMEFVSMHSMNYYHGTDSKPSDKDKYIEERKLLDSNAQKWRIGATEQDRWIGSTEAFGSGIDKSSVRFVIMADVWTLVALYQESGRAGRDGLPSVVHFVFSHHYRPPLSAIDAKDPLLIDWYAGDHQCANDLCTFAHTTECRRVALHRPIDGQSTTCAALNGELCDNCRLHSEVSLTYQAASVFNPTSPLIVVDQSSEDRFSTNVAGPDKDVDNFDDGREGRPPTTSSVQRVTVSTVQSAAEELRVKRGDKISKVFEMVKRALHSAKYSECLGCWIEDDKIEGRHSHPILESAASQLDALRNHIIFDARRITHPMCKNCLTTFSPPFLHCRVKSPLDPADCEYGDIMVKFILYGYLNPTIVSGMNMRKLIADGLKEKEWRDLRQLGTWLSSESRPNSTPKPFKFVAAFLEGRKLFCIKNSSSRTCAAVQHFVNTVYPFLIQLPCLQCYVGIPKTTDNPHEHSSHLDRVIEGKILTLQSIDPPWPIETCRKCWAPKGDSSGHSQSSQECPVEIGKSFVSFVAYFAVSAQLEVKKSVLEEAGYVSSAYGSPETFVEWCKSCDSNGAPRVVVLANACYRNYNSLPD